MIKKHKTRPDAASGRQAGKSLTSLQPIDTTSFRKPASVLFICLSILVVWLLSLLPWRLWAPAPDLLLLVIAFWSLNEPSRINMPVAFVFGLLMDVHDSGLLGSQALAYTLTVYGTLVLHRRLQRFNALVQALHLLPVFVLAQFASRLVTGWLVGEWVGWDWLWSALFTTALWPLVDILLHLPQRRLDDTDAGAG